MVQESEDESKELEEKEELVVSKDQVSNLKELEIDKEANHEGSKQVMISSSVDSNEMISLRGVALKNSTNVYSEASQSSSVLKSYKQGHILIFQAHDPDWYIATIYISGERHTGYIHSSDVDVINDPQRLKGFL